MHGNLKLLRVIWVLRSRRTGRILGGATLPERFLIHVASRLR